MKQIYILFFSLFIITFSSCKKHDLNEPIPTPENPVLSAETSLLTFSPALPLDNQPVTITLDASKGNKGLLDVAGDIYIHTGVITDQSKSASDWKYVKISAFNTDEPLTKMTSLGNHKYQFTLNPRSFYSVSTTTNEKILKLAMVFRDKSGNKVGRNTDGSDIYVPIYEANKLAVSFTSPEFEPTYIPKPIININAVGQELSVSAVSSASADLTLT